MKFEEKKSKKIRDGIESEEVCTNDETVLEGLMISEKGFVLVNRKAGKVYSATEQLSHNGERKQIGKLDDEGRVVIFQNTEKDVADSSVNLRMSGNDPTASLSFPFETDQDDHCESPLEAYEDIFPILKSYAQLIQKERNDGTRTEKLCIYDPYFCNGRVSSHLEGLGNFITVYNRKEDCYKVWREPSRYPFYDIFLTNPPYSGDHVEKLMRHVTISSKPWMLLMPTFVHKKDYFQRLTTKSCQNPIYLVPKKRYVYLPPSNFRVKKDSGTHKKSSPFITMWYIWGGSKKVTNEWYWILRSQHSNKFEVARSKSALRDLRRKRKT